MGLRASQSHRLTDEATGRRGLCEAEARAVRVDRLRDAVAGEVGAPGAVVGDGVHPAFAFSTGAVASTVYLDLLVGPLCIHKLRVVEKSTVRHSNYLKTFNVKTFKL